MQMQSKKFLLLSVLFVTLLGGCKKNQQKDGSNKSSVSKSSKKMKRNKKDDQSADAFDLDADSMKSFALDDQLSKHEKGSKAAQTVSENPMFSWENLNAEESKRQFKTLYFEFDKDDLTPEQQVALKHDIEEIQKMIKQGKIIVIEGHACHSAGSAIYNMTLSEQRAKFIATKFVDAGVDKASIKVAARGQEMPVHKGGNRHQQAVNRRVEVFAIDSK